ncbi:MAG: excinuclease ABC subunit UvrA [Methanoculleus sp.]|uniref:excinuclease ABC subunit UvrA n=2 Tax=Methanoculleus TaxID=45989 RepID=UPI0025F4B88C|nr:MULTISPECIES: excinuclease ABC subunit UvrA [unclassified Methanoculleus]MCK9317079.1 excinuclease ABC subunit UvrA [Methanoculleus sp.]MDD2253430.1 excinuclease ABC subunit UvrA [Methanoculleus sp.]MDD3214991.1 excinuclease ABC subunit UvrA [Methanoculleus sp.]MDD4313965.1 excinuclease ABC subunit UvrA [Methanoculleus sp.]MDD4470300.1 excinuclease ABC subunit UvrA [Methanoculleus sp.]
MKKIVIKGAREHNLNNITVELPRDRLIVLTGVSGSGKSTLAFDTIYAEGQRRYVESLSAYARQFLGLMQKPDVDSIDGLSPAISIEQKTTSKNPRSTVGTVTEIYDYLRLLFARIGKPFCPEHQIPIEAQSPEKIADHIAEVMAGTVTILAPVVRQKKGTYQQVFKDLDREGYTRVRVNGEIRRTDEEIALDRYRKHDIDVVIDRLSVDERSRLVEAIENALAKSEGLVIAVDEDGREETCSSLMACPICGIAFEELQPRMFSFNSPFGACDECNGLGIKMEFDPDLIIPDRNKSIAEGAVMLYRNFLDGYRNQYLSGVAKHFGFSVLTPIKDLTEQQYTALMFGSPEHLRLSMKMKNGDAWSRSGTWEGLVPQTERLYRQTQSEYRRRELEKFMRVLPCPKCGGKRLKDKVLAVKVAGKSIVEVTDLSITGALSFFRTLDLTESEREIAKQVLKEIIARLEFLKQVGVGYLTLSRSAGSLSGGEAQRIRLATQIGSNLTGVLYVLDEPSIGLHQRDNRKLLETLQHLRDLGNTLVVVEHDEETIRSADWVVDMGPGAGLHGGDIVAQGPPDAVSANPASLTGRYLSGDLRIEVPPDRRRSDRFIRLAGCRENNLKGIDANVPIGVLTVVTGVSGSGKSTLIYETLYRALMQKLHNSREPPGKHDSLTFDDEIDKVIVIDQSPIGRTPRSNPATYTKVFDEIRKVFAGTKEAKVRGYKPGRFSFNVKGGRCEACQGDGLIKIEMNFLPDVYVECEECKGARYNRETLEVKYRGKSIADVLEMSVEEAIDHFEHFPSIKNKLDTLSRVGLGYIKLGQSSTTLSGGEAQRIKLTRELAKRATGKTIYLLDEPTTGLHFHDVKNLIAVLDDLVARGNTMVVIEHNLDVIKSADYVIDLGPEGGDAGGEVVAAGTPEEVAAVEGSHTGAFLKEILKTP